MRYNPKENTWTFNLTGFSTEINVKKQEPNTVWMDKDWDSAFIRIHNDEWPDVAAMLVVEDSEEFNIGSNELYHILNQTWLENPNASLEHLELEVKVCKNAASAYELVSFFDKSFYIKQLRAVPNYGMF